MTWSFEQLMVSEAEALVEAQESMCASVMVHRLLSGMCDAVVHLDVSNEVKGRFCPGAVLH